MTTISLSGLDMPFLDPSKRAKGRFRLANHKPRSGKRSDFPCPNIQSDMCETFSHVDGKTYSSRKDWRDHLKAHGMIELGNNMPAGPAPPQTVSAKDIADAYDQCEAGHGAKVQDNPPEGWSGNVTEYPRGGGVR